MRKTEKKSLLVFPSDDSEEEEISIVKQYLGGVGFSTADQEWLVGVFKRPDCFGDPTGKSVFRHDESGAFSDDLLGGLNTLKERVQLEEKGDQTFLAFLFSLMLNFGPGGDSRLSPNKAPKKSDSSWELPQWVGEFQKHAAFCAERLDWNKLRKGSSNTTFDFDGLLFFLFPEVIPVNRIVNLDLLDSIRPGGSNKDFDDPQQLGFWLIWRFRAEEERRDFIRLDTLRQDFSDFPDDVLGDKFRGFYYTIHRSMTYASAGTLSQKRLNPVGDGWKVVAHELIPFLELLNARKPELSQERSSLLKAWWHLATVIYSWAMGSLESELSDDLKNKLIESASRHIGILRSVLRDTPEVFKDENVSDFYDKAFYILLSFAPGWKCLKPLLLAFTEMTQQAVASDLRTWSEHDSTENPPQPYARVPNWIEVAMYPQNLKSEQEEDPDLQNLREEFAKFCLGRLRTKVKNKETVYIT